MSTKNFFFYVISIAIATVVVVESVFFIISSVTNIHMFAVTGTSMEPTIKANSAILVKGTKKPVKNDVIMFNKPKSWLYANNEKDILIKRVVAVQGDTLYYNGSSFFVNGKEVFNAVKHNFDCTYGDAGYKHTLSKGEVFVFGDNYKVSLDSRRVFCDGYTKQSFVKESLWKNYGKLILNF